MKKWCIIDDMTTRRSLEEVHAFDSKESALREAEAEWNSLTECDKQARDHYTVGLCNVEEYKPGCWTYAEDEQGNVDCDVYEIAKVFK